MRRPECILGIYYHAGASTTPMSSSNSDKTISPHAQAILDAVERARQMTEQAIRDMGLDPAEVQRQYDERPAWTGGMPSLPPSPIAFSADKTPLEDPMQAIVLATAPKENIVNFGRSQVKKTPVPLDSLQCAVRYFPKSRWDSRQSSLAPIDAFIRAQTSRFGEPFATEACRISFRAGLLQSEQSNNENVKAKLASEAGGKGSVAKQSRITGTLALVIAQDYRDAVVLDPSVLDAYEAVKVFNTVFPSIPIQTESLEAMAHRARPKPETEQRVLRAVSGLNLVSCVVVTVDIFDSTDSESEMENLANALRERLQDLQPTDVEADAAAVNQQVLGDLQQMFDALAIRSKYALSFFGMQPVSDTLSHFKSGRYNLAGSAIPNRSHLWADVGGLSQQLADYIGKSLAGEIGVPVSRNYRNVPASEIAEAWLEKYHPDNRRRPANPT